MNLTPQQNRRHIRLVDHVLQKSLLVVLVIMETVVVAFAIWTLYKALGEIVDENMYRIHFLGSVNVLSLLISEGMRVLGGILLVNLLALIIADRIWAFYVNGILRNLGRLMTASSQLNFSKQDPISFNHPVLEQALAWRESESSHLAKVRDRIRHLPAHLPALKQDRDAIAAVFAKMQDG